MMMSRDREFFVFLSKYDSGNLCFSTLKFRQGARITSSFGLVPGYRKVDDRFVWDTVRIHTGVDRSGNKNRNGQVIKNVVFAPFDFDRSEFIEYGPDHVYGTLVRLFNDEFGFEMRIMHMNRREMPIRIVEHMKKGLPVRRNEYLGKAGSEGMSDGDHTHTEFVSQQDRCAVLDALLYSAHGRKSQIPYSERYLIQQYRSKAAFTDATKQEILSDWGQQKMKRRVSGVINDYKMEYFDWFNDGPATRYSSDLLFNGL